MYEEKMMMIGLALSVIAGGVFADGTGNAVQAAPQKTAIAKDVEKFSKNSTKIAPIKRFTI